MYLNTVFKYKVFKYCPSLTIAEVEQCIIGVDFLTHHDISVRPRTKQLTHAASGSTVIAKGINTANISPLCENTDNTPDYVLKLLSQYPAIGSDISYDRPIKHDVVHRIQLDDSQRPLSTRPRRLGPDVGEAACSALQKLLDDKTLVESNTPWCSPLHHVPIKSGSWHFVGDYRRLNGVTKKDSYILPYIGDFPGKLHGQAVFSTMDLKDANHQIPVHPDDIEKTAICTLYGNFQYKRMPFGLCGAAQTFQRFIDKVTCNLTVPEQDPLSPPRKVNYFAFIDDILVVVLLSLPQRGQSVRWGVPGGGSGGIGRGGVSTGGKSPKAAPARRKWTTSHGAHHRSLSSKLVGWEGH